MEVPPLELLLLFGAVARVKSRPGNLRKVRAFFYSFGFNSYPSPWSFVYVILNNN